MTNKNKSIVREGYTKSNLKEPPTADRPPPPRSQVAFRPSKTESLADRFKAKFSQAHSQSRPLIISWELAVEIRDALSGDSPAPDTGLAGQIEAARARIAGWPADVRAAMGLPDETSPLLAELQRVYGLVNYWHDEAMQLRTALSAISTNTLKSSTNKHPQYASGVAHGLGIAADMARTALTQDSSQPARQSPQGSVPTVGAPTAPAAPGSPEEPTPSREPTAFQDFVASLPEKASERRERNHERYADLGVLPTEQPEMAMLPNDHHPGPRCSCRECLDRYPSENGNGDAT